MCADLEYAELLRRGGRICRPRTLRTARQRALSVTYTCTSTQFPLAMQVLATTDEKPGIVYADLDYAELDTRRLNMPISDQKRRDLYALVDKAPA